MSKISLAPDASGTGIFTIASPGTSTNRTLTLPDDTGTIVTNSGNQAGSFTTLNTSGAVVFNDAGADVDFRVEGDTDANLLFVDASTDRVGIGTNTPDALLSVDGIASFGAGSASTPSIAAAGDLNTGIFFPAADTIAFAEGGAEAIRITSDGELLVGTTSMIQSGFVSISVDQSVRNGIVVNDTHTGGAINAPIVFRRNSSGVGSISTTTTSTAYNTSSDYRLKHDILHMTGAIAKVQQLKPVTYKWNLDDSAGEGFIAHELQAVCPDAVTGVKDETEIQQVEVSPAVPATYDEEGNELTPAVEAVYEEREVPKYQGVDTSFLVATLTAAIQELKAELDEAKARIAALEGQ
jgi:hypothetical protein